MIVPPETKKPDQDGKELRGITKYVVTNGKCTQTNSKNILGKITVLAGICKAKVNISASREKAASTEGEIQKYIKELYSQLTKNKSGLELQGLNTMKTLLLEMVDADPAKRPTMADVLVRYEQAIILQKGSTKV